MAMTVRFSTLVPQLYDPWVKGMVRGSGEGGLAASGNIPSHVLANCVAGMRRKISDSNQLRRNYALAGGLNPAIRHGPVEVPRVQILRTHRRGRKKQ